MLELVRRLGCRDARLAFPVRSTRLSAMLIACGIQHQTTPDYDWHGLRRGEAKFVSFQYTVAGQGRLTFEGQEHTVEPGQAVLLFFPHDHRYWVPKGGSWEFVYVSMNGRELVRMFRDLVGRVGPLVHLAEDGPALRQAAAICRAALEERVTSPFVASSLAYALTMAVLEEATSPALDAPMPAWLPRVVRFCQANLHRPIEVDDLAAVAKLSRHHFSRKFQESRGTSPGRFLVECRLREASRLVLDTRLPIHVVAERCGYNDANYFCKAFRREFGLAPGVMRRTGMR